MSNYERKFIDSTENAHPINVASTLLGILLFIVYGKWMFDAHTHFLLKTQDFAGFIVIILTLLVFVGNLFFSYFFSSFLMVFFPFIKDSAKSKEDYAFIVEYSLLFFMCAVGYVLYHVIVCRATYGFEFYSSILFIAAAIVFFVSFITFLPKMKEFILFHLNITNETKTVDSKQAVKEHFSKKTKRKETFEISSSEFYETKQTMSNFHDASFSLKNELEEHMAYIFQNKNYLFATSDRHIFNRIITQDLLNLIVHFQVLNDADKITYKDVMVEELNRIKDELVLLKSTIDEKKRSNVEKSIHLSKERYKAKKTR